VSTHECAAPPGDPVFGQASSAAGTMNLGIAAAGVGVAALAGGLVWYYAGAKTVKESPSQQAIAPWLSGRGGGVAVLGRF
jgi:membrane protein DedA with SNARE-associated domain